MQWVHPPAEPARLVMSLPLLVLPHVSRAILANSKLLQDKLSARNASPASSATAAPLSTARAAPRVPSACACLDKVHVNALSVLLGGTLIALAKHCAWVARKAPLRTPRVPLNARSALWASLRRPLRERRAMPALLDSLRPMRVWLSASDARAATLLRILAPVPATIASRVLINPLPPKPDACPARLVCS